MEIFDHLMLGFSVALSMHNVFYAFIGCLLGTLIGILPGLGPTATIAVLLPITFTLNPITALIMLAGIYYGAAYGGSITSILMNLPGEVSTVVTTLDGYQMARKGRAGAALTAAAVGSFVAGCFGTVVIAVIAVPMAAIAYKFGPAAYTSLIALGLIGSVVLATGSVIKALGMIVLGLLLGTVGTDIASGVVRYGFDIPEMRNGLSFVIVAMGLFGYGEIIANLSHAKDRAVDTVKFRLSDLYPTRRDWKLMTPAIMRGSLVGTFLGVLPGGGAVMSSFAAYTLEKKTKLKADEVAFGSGNIRGVAAPEAANNAGSQTAFIPMLTLGLPPNAVLAMLIGAMVLHGIQPGPQVMTTNPDLFWGLVASMWIGNAILVALNLPLVGLWVKLLEVPYRLLFPAIVLFCAIGAYALSHSAWNVWLLGLFGVIGYVFNRLEMEPAPLLLALVLGPMMEEYMRRALLLSRGDWTIFITQPISAALLALALILLIILIVPAVRNRRREAFQEDPE